MTYAAPTATLRHHPQVSSTQCKAPQAGRLRFTSAGFTVPTSWAGYTIVTGDFNGDGKTDIALISHTSGSPHLIYLSTGTGFELAASIPNTDTSTNAVVADWNNDGAADIWLQKVSGDTEILFSYVPELMTSVSNGVGATTTITYDRMNHGTVYTKGSGATYPQQDLIGPYYVVSQLSTSNGIGGNYNVTYAYTGAKTDVSRNYPNPGPKSNLMTSAFVTFSTVAATDAQTGIVRTTNYETGYPYYGLRSQETVTSGTVTLRQVVNTYTSTNLGGSGPGAAYYFNSTFESVVSANDLDGTAFPTATYYYDYDSYGNVTGKTTDIGTQIWATSDTYNNNTTSWILGQLLTSQMQVVFGSPITTLTRNWSYSYSPTSGLLIQAVVEPGVSALSYTATIGYDAYGNRNSVALSGSGVSTRTSGVTYDSLGEFPITATNALSQSDQYTYNAAFGETLTHTDPNTIESKATYDTFGRPLVATKPDGNQTSVSYLYCSGVNGGSASCPTYGAYLAQATPENASGGQNGAIAITYYDALGRVIATETQGFDGSWIEVSTQYNSNGRVSETSRPYFVSGGTPEWTSYTYDVLGRVTKATFPDGSATTYGYNGRSTSVTNANGQTTTTILNQAGQVEFVIDANGNGTTYMYDGFGDLTSVTDPAGNVTTNTYDLRGRKIYMMDPDLGSLGCSYGYTYDVLSELTSQADANGNTTTFTYDLLGRPLKRTEPDLTSEWTYDAETDGIGQLAHTCSDDPCSDATYETTQLYDTYGRISSKKLKRSGTNFTYTMTYNSDGRLATLEYPSGFIAKYVYTSLGYLSEIENNSSGTAYWTANTRDAELHLLQATAGNGVVTNQNFNAETGRLAQSYAGPSQSVANFSYAWDPIGNLTSRADTIEGYTENFCYDNLNRLTNYALGSTCTSSGTTTVAYDALGDITSKSDVGTYTYPASGPTSSLVHAVSSITGTVNGVVNPTFTYDLNGNMLTGAGRTVTYTSYNMPATVTEGTTTSAFVYSTAHARMQQCVPNCTSPTTTTYYINDPATGSMEEEVVSGSTTTWHDFIIADGGIVAELFKTGSTTTPVYFNGDHLGSASVLANASGTVTERDSYDPWGKRRNPNGTPNSTCSITSQATRGYTAQEMMDPVCLINLNARLYDPTIARIMSADPTVPHPLNPQSFNRYSYVENRPLSATDPSGYDDDGYEPPCYGCSGPGWDTNSNGSVYNVADAYQTGGFFTVTTTNADGTTNSTTYNTPIALAAALAGIVNANAANGIATDIDFGLAGMSGGDENSGNTTSVGADGDVEELGGDAATGDTNGSYHTDGVTVNEVDPSTGQLNSVTSSGQYWASDGFQNASYLQAYPWNPTYGNQIAQGIIPQDSVFNVGYRAVLLTRPGDKVTILAAVGQLPSASVGGDDDSPATITAIQGSYSIYSSSGGFALASGNFFAGGNGNPLATSVNFDFGTGSYDVIFYATDLTLDDVAFQLYDMPGR